MALSGFVFWQDKFSGLMTFTLFLPFALDEIKAMFRYIVIFFYNQLLVQRISCKNSQNRQNVKVHHRAGSKTFSQCGFEKVITSEAHDHASLPFEISLICYILA